MQEMGVFQAIHTARALRRLKPDPVPDDLVAKVIDAAVRAPTGSNLQGTIGDADPVYGTGPTGDGTNKGYLNDDDIATQAMNLLAQRQPGVGLGRELLLGRTFRPPDQVGGRHVGGVKDAVYRCHCVETGVRTGKRFQVALPHIGGG